MGDFKELFSACLVLNYARFGLELLNPVSNHFLLSKVVSSYRCDFGRLWWGM